MRRPLLLAALTISFAACASGPDAASDATGDDASEEDALRKDGNLTSDREGIPSAIESSTRIVNARWTTRSIGMMHQGQDLCRTSLAGSDVHPYTFADDGHLYTANNDTQGPNGGTESHLEVLRLSRDHVGAYKPVSCGDYTGTSHITPSHVGKNEPFGGDLQRDWSYSTGITSVHGTLFMVHSGRYPDGARYRICAPSEEAQSGGTRNCGFGGIAFSTDHGGHWHRVRLPSGFSAGHAVSMYFVQEGQDSPHSHRAWNTAPGPNGERYLYAITHDREFAGSKLRLGRVVVPEPWHHVASAEYVANLANWEWFDHFEGDAPQFTSDASAARSLPGESPDEFLHEGIMYPSMAYDAAAGVYLLAMSKINHKPSDPEPGWCRSNPKCSTHNFWEHSGARTLLFEGANPWGPFRFVAQDDHRSRRMKYSVELLTKDQGSIGANGKQRLFFTHTGQYGQCWGPECDGSSWAYGDYGTSFRALEITVKP